jgi:hypothetical protein
VSHSLNFDVGYLPITTNVMLRAAEFWAHARNMGNQLLRTRLWMRTDSGRVCGAGTRRAERAGVN